MRDSLLDVAPCGFVSFSDDGTMLAVNATLAEMLGYARVELEGWHVQKILTPGSRVFYQTHVFPMLKLHGRAEEIYIALRANDGSDIPILMNGVRRERAGAFVSDCVLLRVLQRSRYEDQLLDARRVAEEANAAKGKFLSMMSHDLRTPLTAILGFTQLLEAGVQGPVNDEQRDALQRVRIACSDLLRLINDILGFAQLDSGRVEVHLERVGVRDAVARAETLVRLSAEDAGLALEIGCADIAVHADADRLQQILLNLLTNAIKFTARGGRVTVSCESTGERVRIRVRDTGIGIAPEQLERIFEPFVQLESQGRSLHRGVGLGLAISRELARAMNGELSAESMPGQGALFTLELPTMRP